MRISISLFLLRRQEFIESFASCVCVGTFTDFIVFILSHTKMVLLKASKLEIFISKKKSIKWICECSSFYVSLNLPKKFNRKECVWAFVENFYKFYERLHIANYIFLEYVVLIFISVIKETSLHSSEFSS